MLKVWLSSFWSSKYNSIALCRVDSQKDPNLPNVHCECIAAYKLALFLLHVLVIRFSSVVAVATFKIVIANKYKSRERLNEIKQRLK